MINWFGYKAKSWFCFCTNNYLWKIENVFLFINDINSGYHPMSWHLVKESSIRQDQMIKEDILYNNRKS